MTKWGRPPRRRADVPLSELVRRQTLLVDCLGRLYEFATSKGWKIALGDGYRPDRKGHMANSLHYERLAQDLVLRVHGVLQEVGGPEWSALGAFWKGLDVLARWGGDFASRDYNHFSVTYLGRSARPGAPAVREELGCMTRAQRRAAHAILGP